MLPHSSRAATCGGFPQPRASSTAPTRALQVCHEPVATIFPGAALEGATPAAAGAGAGFLPASW